MNAKTLVTLEFPKILNRLVTYSGFSASAELALAIKPTSDLEIALNRQARTREARYALSVASDLDFNGATDLRPMVTLAERDGVLEPQDFLAIKNTLIIARSTQRILETMAEDISALAQIGLGLPSGLGLVDMISKTVSDRGEVLDTASDALGRIRSELKITFDRLMARLQKYITDPSTVKMLQEALITQRSGRYVIPLRAEFKGRIKAVIHDQSSSGATLFIEPLPIVDWNNRYRELELAERDEIHRILHSLSQRVAEHGQELTTMVKVLAELDLACMCAKYAEDMHASEPELVAFETKVEEHLPGSSIKLIQARHPLLDPEKVVPIDVELDDQTYVLIITGPNTGGKTVTLKTVGLFTIMAQSGLQIPARSGSRLSIFKDVFADIGDEQSIEQSLSTFSGHITQMVSILKKADSQSLVLLDELGAGTDPQEGSALAMAVLNHLLERRITSMVATHYPELKAFAHTTPHVVNASVEFDLATLKPTYHLTIGLPGRSNALAIAERLGLPEEIIAAAKAEINPADLRAEDLLDEIHRQRDLAREAYQAADQSLREADVKLEQVNAKLEQIEDERIAILEETRKQTNREVESLREEMEALRRDLARAHQPLDVLDEVEEKIEEIEAEVEEPIERKTPAVRKGKRPTGPLRLGEKVHLKSIDQDGVITSLSENGVEVQVGVLRVRAKRTEVIRKSGSEEAPSKPSQKPKSTSKISLPIIESPGLELDIRGQRVDEATESLLHYLERAYLAGLPYVRIIHGKGTGVLRQSIREVIKQNPHISRWESGGEKEGGEGVTIAFIQTQ
ncbi:MAG: endonuclease MutS2 [Anaerolineaceae bacterium]|nr:endonuclease MutS2 [Anaerolineaceae bacterium]